MKNNSEKVLSVYDIYKRYLGDTTYPELILKAIKNPHILDYQLTKAHIIFDQWAEQYSTMNQINQNRYRVVIKKILKEMKNVHILGRAPNGIGILYFIHYDMWSDLTTYIQKGLEKNLTSELNLLWKICFNLINIFKPQQLSDFTDFIANKFQPFLLIYNPQNNSQNVQILQIVKFINLYEARNPFIENGKKWVQKIRKMQIVIPKQEKPQLTEEEENYTIHKREELRRLKPKIQVNPFVEVFGEDEKLLYEQAQIQKQILQCRSLLVLISEEFWLENAHNIILKMQQGIKFYSNENPIHLLNLQTFLKLLKYKKIKEIIAKGKTDLMKQMFFQINENIVQSGSPLKVQPYSHFPYAIRDIIVSDDAKLKKQLIKKNLSDLVTASFKGIQHYESRFFMSVCSQEDFQLSPIEIRDVVKILSLAHLQSTMSIDLFIVLLKVLRAGIQQSEFHEEHFSILVLAVSNINKKRGLYDPSEQSFKTQANKFFKAYLQKNQLRINPNKNIQALIKWLLQVQVSSTKTNNSVLQLLFLILNGYAKILIEIDLTPLTMIINNSGEKIDSESTFDDIYNFLNCVIKTFIQIGYSDAQKQLDLVCPAVMTHEYFYLRKQCELILKDAQYFKKSSEKKSLKTDLKSKKSLAVEYFQDDAIKIERLQRQFIDDGTYQKIIFFLENHELWKPDNPILYVQLMWFECCILKALMRVEEMLKEDQVNPFMKAFLQRIDKHLLVLYDKLFQEESFEVVFILASKVYFISKDYFEVKKLKSFKYVQEKCFEVLSDHFNRNMVLLASSIYCSLLISYINNEKERKRVYEDLNQREFMTDIFKGVDHFLGGGKLYNLVICQILMSFDITECFRQEDKFLIEDLSNLRKNLIWWEDADRPLNISILDREEAFENENLLTPFKQFYINEVKKFYEIKKMQIKRWKEGKLEKTEKIEKPEKQIYI